MKNSISVIIPAYNEEKFIERSLESLKEQTLQPSEILVVDNNSTDDTARIAKQYKVRVVKEKRQGMIHARNCGFDSAKSSIVARCDADTILPKDWLERIRDDFQQHRIDAVSGPIMYYDLPFPSPIPSRIYMQVVKFLSYGKDIMIGPNMAITKKMWNKIREKVSLDDSQVHEDVDLALHIGQAGGKILVDNSLVVQTSARRIKSNPASFCIEYPVRLIKTFQNNQM